MELNAKYVIRKYVNQHYGNLISVDEPKFDVKGKTWIAELKSDYPRIICDDRCPNERIVKFLSLRRLGTVQVQEDLQNINATSRDICVQNLSGYLDLWQKRAERIIVTASADNFADIGEVKWVLGKIGTIISHLQWNKAICDFEINLLSTKEAEKIRKYLKLLESLEIVKYAEKRYSYGNMFTELVFQTGNDPQKLSKAILSYIIKTRYSALREVFNITQLDPFVHVDSCYYRPALEADELIYWTKDSFARQCAIIYGRRSKVYFRLPYILQELVNVNALNYQDNLFFGNEILFKEMQKMKSEFSDMTSPRAC
ncbi:MAG: hypothetical protein IAX21_06490 [Candidatus Bathyarchaeota archaeon]|nr:MAG: hypothetical protein NUK63_10940 [Candidatus Bathyarchaeum tardum]WNZ28319.1 MAG: hypothetical protein IAX21_06490 [Candidatus Bathyarchaeota archaeon]